MKADNDTAVSDLAVSDMAVSDVAVIRRHQTGARAGLAEDDAVTKTMRHETTSARDDLSTCTP